MGMSDADRARLHTHHEAREIMKREIAYHEAGHTVIPWMFGVQSDLQWIDMRSTRHRHAQVRYRDIMLFAIQGNWDRRDPRVVSVMRIAAVKQIMCNLAGTAAAYRVDPEADPDLHDIWYDQLIEDNACPGGKDMALSIRVAQALYGDTGRAWQFLRRMARWTDEALSHPQVWAVVQALADRLQSTRARLSGSTANRIMDRAWGLPGTFPLLLMGRKWRRRCELTRHLKAPDLPAPQTLDELFELTDEKGA
jgi:hypothetical protein